jgi:hypothetical protein
MKGHTQKGALTMVENEEESRHKCKGLNEESC